MHNKIVDLKEVTISFYFCYSLKKKKTCLGSSAILVGTHYISKSDAYSMYISVSVKCILLSNICHLRKYRH